jgi:hypothetical protein
VEAEEVVEEEAEEVELVVVLVASADLHSALPSSSLVA